MITKAEFTLEQLVDTVRELAKANPDFCYKSDIESISGSGQICFYTKGSNCNGCLFGQAILKLQPNLYNYLDSEDAHCPPTITVLLHDILSNDSDYSWCQLVQLFQDSGRSWGNSVIKADDEVDYNG